MSNVFGWHYPPGCSGPPDIYDMPCALCLESEDRCCCPECPECQAVGDYNCYENHGMRLSLKQHQTMQRVRAELKAEHRQERIVTQHMYDDLLESDQ